MKKGIDLLMKEFNESLAYLITKSELPPSCIYMSLRDAEHQVGAVYGQAVQKQLKEAKEQEGKEDGK
ncbi:MAG: hypothetical protein SPJ65_05955 [Roseburia sp.]|nr:hypothetical protein [Roseburia sp.]